MSIAQKFNIPAALFETIKKLNQESNEYQMKVKALMKKKGIASLGQLSPDEKKAFFNQLDSMHQAKNEETEIEEAKSSTGYELYHKDFSSAMAHAYDFAKKKYNIEIDPLEIDRNVAMGPKKPSSGKANAYRLLDKTGKKAIQVQVANLDNKRYELNMYKEDVDQVEEAAKNPEAMKDFLVKFEKNGKVSVRNYTGKSDLDVESKAKVDAKRTGMSIASIRLKEEVELEEAEGGGTSIKDPQTQAKNQAERAKLSLQSAMLRMKQAKEREAIQKKKQAIKEEVSLEEQKPVVEADPLEEMFSQGQIDMLKKEYAKIDRINPDSENYKKLVAMLDKQDKASLEKLAGGGIKFVSGLAKNRINRMKMKEGYEKIFSEAVKKKEATAKDKNKSVKSGDKLSGKAEPVEVDPELKEQKS